MHSRFTFLGTCDHRRLLINWQLHTHRSEGVGPYLKEGKERKRERKKTYSFLQLSVKVGQKLFHDIWQAIAASTSTSTTTTSIASAWRTCAAPLATPAVKSNLHAMVPRKQIQWCCVVPAPESNNCPPGTRAQQLRTNIECSINTERNSTTFDISV